MLKIFIISQAFLLAISSGAYAISSSSNSPSFKQNSPVVFGKKHHFLFTYSQASEVYKLSQAASWPALINKNLGQAELVLLHRNHLPYLENKFTASSYDAYRQRGQQNFNSLLPLTSRPPRGKEHLNHRDAAIEYHEHFMQQNYKGLEENLRNRKKPSFNMESILNFLPTKAEIKL